MFDEESAAKLKTAWGNRIDIPQRPHLNTTERILLDVYNVLVAMGRFETYYTRKGQQYQRIRPAWELLPYIEPRYGIELGIDDLLALVKIHQELNRA